MHELWDQRTWPWVLALQLTKRIHLRKLLYFSEFQFDNINTTLLWGLMTPNKGNVKVWAQSTWPLAFRPPANPPSPPWLPRHGGSSSSPVSSVNLLPIIPWLTKLPCCPNLLSVLMFQFMSVLSVLVLFASIPPPPWLSASPSFFTKTARTGAVARSTHSFPPLKAPPLNTVFSMMKHVQPCQHGSVVNTRDFSLLSSSVSFLKSGNELHHVSVHSIMHVVAI